MMIDIYTVNAFTDELFKGNPAAVCPSFRDVPHSTDLDKLFQKIATEMNLPETAFITQATNSSSNTRYFLQWFSPTMETDLCGHATLATAHILFERIFKDSSVNELIFETKYAGELKVKKCDQENYFELNFPIGDPQPIEFDNQIINEIKLKLNLSSTQEILAIQLCKRTKYLLIHLSTMDENIKPQENLTEIDFGQTINPWISGIIITSTSTTADFVSRFFTPWYGILEDPVTGSTHTVLAVYWSRLLNNEKLIFHAYQQSLRGGYVDCEIDEHNQRVLLRGSALTVIQGQFLLQKEQLNLLKIK
jgi:PhzF family phenazine biosynthesis protein